MSTKWISLNAYFHSIPHKSICLVGALRETIATLLALLPLIFTPIVLFRHDSFPTDKLQFLINSLNYLSLVFVVIISQPKISTGVKNIIYLATGSLLGGWLGYLAQLIASGNIWVRPVTSSFAMIIIYFFNRTNRPRPVFSRIASIFIVVIGLFQPNGTHTVILYWMFAQVSVAIAAVFVSSMVIPLYSSATMTIQHVPSLLSLLARQINYVRIKNIAQNEHLNPPTLVKVAKEEEGEIQRFIGQKNEKLPALLAQINKIKALLRGIEAEKFWMGDEILIFFRQFLTWYEKVTLQLLSLYEFEEDNEGFPERIQPITKEIRSILFVDLSNFEVLLIQRIDLLANIAQDYISRVHTFQKKGCLLAWIGLQKYVESKSCLDVLLKQNEENYQKLENAVVTLLDTLPRCRKVLDKNIQDIQQSHSPLEFSDIQKSVRCSIKLSCHVFSIVGIAKYTLKLSQLIIPDVDKNKLTKRYSSAVITSSELNNINDNLNSNNNYPNPTNISNLNSSNNSIKTSTEIKKETPSEKPIPLIGTYVKRGDCRIAFFVILFGSSYNYLLDNFKYFINFENWKEIRSILSRGWKKNTKSLFQDHNTQVCLRLVFSILSISYIIFVAQGFPSLANPPGERRPQPALWIVITVLFLFAPSFGATFFFSLWRIIATWLGAFFGFLAVLSALSTVNGTDTSSILPPLLLIIFTFLASASSSFIKNAYPKYWYAGLIFSVTYIVVAMGNYSEFDSSLGYAVTRGVAIVIGSVYALFVSLLIFPYFSVRDLRHTLSSDLKKSALLFSNIVTLLTKGYYQSEQQNEELRESVNEGILEIEKQILLQETLLNDSKFEFFYEAIHKRISSQKTLASSVNIFKELSLSVNMVSVMVKGNKTCNTMNDLIDFFLQEITGEINKNKQQEMVSLQQRKEFLSVISPLDSYLNTFCGLIQSSAVFVKDHLLRNERGTWRHFFGKRGSMETEMGMGGVDHLDENTENNESNCQTDTPRTQQINDNNTTQSNQGESIIQSLTQNMENLISAYYHIRSQVNFGSPRCLLHQKFFLLFESSLFTTFKVVENWIQLINTINEAENTKSKKGLKEIKTTH